MKKVFSPILSAILFIICVQTSAQIVSEKTARNAAYSILNAKNAVVPVSAADLVSVAVPGTSVTNPEIFIFNNPSGGFAIISGDKSATPVIGYSTSGSVPAGQWRSNFAWWMQNAVDQIQYYRQHATKSTSEIDEEWDFLLSGNTTNNPFHSTKDILPFLRSTWGQDGVFNDQCPEDANGEALVGCVATAMAQVIFYYQFPQTGYGTHSYNAYGYGTQTVNYGAATYNYTEMSGHPSFPMPEVAELSYHCGVAVDMGYGYDGSGAYTWDVPDALTSHFRYASAEYRNRMSYNSTSWATLMRSNLDLYRPVIYSGSGSSGGHAFVMDGYQGTNYFHFDWGWDGSANGYFYLTDMNPASGYEFNDDHQCVESIYPPTASYPYGCTGTKTLTSTFGLIEDGSGPIENYEANGNCSWLISPGPQCDNFKITFKELDLATDDSVKFYAGADASAPLVAAYSGATVPSYFNVGSSQVFIQFTTNAVNQSKGFLFEYVGHIPLGCTGITTLTNPTDTFEDGSGSNAYGNSSFCRWYIQPPGATSISLHFTDFDMGDEFDYIRITDASSNVLGEFYKGDNPTTITAATTKMTVIFQSNTSVVGDGFAAYYTITTGIDEQPEGLSMLVYPNPASDMINIIPGDKAVNATVVIFDFSGRCVYSQPVVGSLLAVPVNELAKGIYSVGLLSDEGNIWQKIVIE